VTDAQRRPAKEIYIAALSAAGIVVSLVLRYAMHVPPQMADWPLLGVLVVGGAPLLFDLAARLSRGEFGSDLLAGMSILAAAALGEYLAGAIIVLMLSGGGALEAYATHRASAVLAALARRMPSSAHRRQDGQLIDIHVNEIRLGDRVVVFPHEICPVDGIVESGRGTMDESYLTGEPFLIAKAPGSTVLSGSVNGEQALAIKVTTLPVDSRYAKIMAVMKEAERNRPRLRRIADRLGAWYTLVGVGVGIAGWIIGHDPKRFLAVLVIATPCPLLLAIPVAILGAISVAASRGIIIKNPAMLERIDHCRTVIFDKTGTLTYGKPALTEVRCAPGVTREQALAMAASLEQYSKHPLASGILDAAREAGIVLSEASEVSERPGDGLVGRIRDVEVTITGRKAVMAKGGKAASALPEPVPGMECVVLLNGDFGAAFRFHDAPRSESGSFIRHLAPRHRVTKVMLVSGDREEEVRYLANEVGIAEVRAGMSPEQKVEIVREEAARGATLFVGDGINDAPAMQAATVGVAFGQQSEITAEAADAVVLEASLSKVDELIHIGRRMRTIALQSAVGGMALSLAGMGLGAAGLLPPVAGAVAQEMIDLLAVLNALRVAVTPANLHDHAG
jgi:heavy metal translocating P-type ATPase